MTEPIDLAPFWPAPYPLEQISSYTLIQCGLLTLKKQLQTEWEGTSQACAGGSSDKDLSALLYGSLSIKPTIGYCRFSLGNPSFLAYHSTLLHGIRDTSWAFMLSRLSRDCALQISLSLKK